MSEAADRVYELWAAISTQHGIDCEFEDPEPSVDFPFIEDQAWNLDLGDDFWETLIQAYRDLEMEKEIPMTVSRLQRSRCLEVGHGWAMIFLSNDGVIQCKAGGIYGEPVLLGATETRHLAAHLRQLAGSSSGDDDGCLEVAPGQHVAVHAELVPASLSPATARERAEALEKAAELARDQTPVVMALSPPSADHGPN
ncbi:MAG: hypothetical protein KJO07_19635 [Deltaproteobacteria bacterium]|nr:hypothetical protein [Deltaproteobacteria bacterium]